MNERSKILSTINHPLGFFVLALLIVETSLAVVLIWSNLEPLQKFYGMWALVTLFLFLIIEVGFLVCKYPKNLIYQAEDHLKEKIDSGIIPPRKEIGKITSNKKNKFALIEYKVDSVLPGTVPFDLITDRKVWFWIANLEEKKYLAYVKTRLKVGDYSKDLDDRYYGGKEPWKLNAFTGIHAPGMPIPKEVIDLVKSGNILDVTIDCEVKDENNVFIEKKLPVTYRYNPKSNFWYLEP